MKTRSPEDLFAVVANVQVGPKIMPAVHPEVVIMTGFPGSGKSTIADQLASASNYVIISGDTLKTPNKMIKAATEFMKSSKKSIIFDATNSTKERRAQFIAFAQKHDMPSRCVWVTTSMDVSYQRNLARPENLRIPRIVYNVYKKNFKEPTNDEGCEVIKM
jgi:bifunctional polynucleotide phosphatase/kinase